MGVTFEVTQAVLNHLNCAKSGIAGVYQRYEWRDEKREALELCRGDCEDCELPDIKAACQMAVQYFGARLVDAGARFEIDEHWQLDVRDEAAAVLFTLEANNSRPDSGSEAGAF